MNKIRLAFFSQLLAWHFFPQFFGIRKTSKQKTVWQFYHSRKHGFKKNTVDYVVTFSGNLRGSFWRCSGLFGGAWERFVEENWSEIGGENPSEVPNETL